jgi:dihydrofolate synthase/folylpolyglutamate synthase
MNSTDMTNIRAFNARGHWGIKRGLENPQKLLEALGNPQNSFKTVLISGTNGKGSTGSFISHALRACGISVGWTTSPHLVSPTERLWINGSNLRLDSLNRLLGDVLKAEAQIGIEATYFELITTVAFLAFHEAKVDIAVVEVGMGGRWDATNVSNPILTILTNVEIDHVAYLGNTREEIAREKLCTARSERPLITGPGLDPNWVRQLLECNPILLPAQKIQADVVAWDHSWIKGHRIQLAGKHQMNNLATAWEALLALKQYGFMIDDSQAWLGIENTTWPGRLWKVPGLSNVFMDGAHNLDGTKHLAAHALSTGMKPHLFFSAMHDKDLEGMKAQLVTMEPIGITLVHGKNPRYASKNTLKDLWGTNLEIFNINRTAQSLKETSEHCRLVCGSLYFLGDLLTALDINPAF